MHVVGERKNFDGGGVTKYQRKRTAMAFTGYDISHASSNATAAAISTTATAAVAVPAMCDGDPAITADGSSASNASPPIEALKSLVACASVATPAPAVATCGASHKPSKLSEQAFPVFDFEGKPLATNPYHPRSCPYCDDALYAKIRAYNIVINIASLFQASPEVSTRLWAAYVSNQMESHVLDAPPEYPSLNGVTLRVYLSPESVCGSDTLIRCRDVADILKISKGNTARQFKHFVEGVEIIHNPAPIMTTGLRYGSRPQGALLTRLGLMHCLCLHQMLRHEPQICGFKRWIVEKLLPVFADDFEVDSATSLLPVSDPPQLSTFALPVTTKSSLSVHCLSTSGITAGNFIPIRSLPIPPPSRQAHTVSSPIVDH